MTVLRFVSASIKEPSRRIVASSSHRETSCTLMGNCSELNVNGTESAGRPGKIKRHRGAHHVG